MSFNITQHLEMPYYDISVNEGVPGSIYGLSFCQPIGFDGVNIGQPERDAIIAAIVNVVEGFEGVESVKVTLYTHATADVTPA